MQTFTPKQYLMIDIANSMGLDKHSWDERLEWFDAHEGSLLSKLPDAENPAMFYAGVKAWDDVKTGKASGYPISLDATSSGIQILSVLTGDRKAALISNVLDSGRRADAYTDLYEAMNKKVGGSMTHGRADLKRAIMTAFYGSEAVPKEVFGEGRLLGVFFETLEQETPFIWELNKAFLNMWNPDAFKYHWVMPDNFHIQMKVHDHVQEDVQFMGQTIATFRVENKPTPTGRSLGANLTHSLDGMIVRELLRRCSFDPVRQDEVQRLICEGPSTVYDEQSNDFQMVAQLWKLYEESGYLSARILDHLDSSNIGLVNTDPLQDLLDSMPKKPFKIIPIHDCFRVHPNYGNDLRKQYNLQLSLIAQSDMLGFLLTQLLGKQTNINKQGHFEEEILQANYALS